MLVIPARRSAPIMQVAQGGHGAGCGPGPHPGGVLGEGHVADPVQGVLDPPVPTEQVGRCAGLAWVKVRSVTA